MVSVRWGLTFPWSQVQILSPPPKKQRLVQIERAVVVLQFVPHKLHAQFFDRSPMATAGIRCLLCETAHVRRTKPPAVQCRCRNVVSAEGQLHPSRPPPPIEPRADRGPTGGNPG
jgi:hypothetical protein